MNGRAVVEVARFADDVDALKRFYAGLLATTAEADWPGGAIFAAGDVKVLVHERPGAGDDGPPNEDQVAIGVADVDHTCRMLLEQGTSLLVEPRDYPWGRSAYVRDPDGRLVELLQSYGLSLDRLAAEDLGDGTAENRPALAKVDVQGAAGKVHP